MDIETIIFQSTKKIDKKTLNSTRFEEKDKNNILKLYSDVFAGDPWNEQYCCVHCGKNYSSDDRKIETIMQKYPRCDNLQYNHPSGKLVLSPAYEGTYFNAAERKIVSNLGKEILEDALQRENFIGILKKNKDKYIGFSWGYKLPRDRSPSVWFDKVQEEMKNRGIDTDNVFYAAEVGVSQEYRGNGIGISLIRDRLEYAKNLGFNQVCLRTINPDLIKAYGKIFGEGSEIELFRDPNPIKTDDDKWYMWDLKNLKNNGV